jgi:hypothetical protein
MTAPALLIVVITGLVPVIHAFYALNLTVLGLGPAMTIFEGINL